MDATTMMTGHDLADMSWTSGPLLGFDLETTGVDRFSDVPVSAALVWFEAGQVTGEDYFVIDPGRPIPAAATNIHGISTESAQQEGIALHEALTKIYDAISASRDGGCPLVGMNLAYDLTMLDVLVQRYLGYCLDESGLCVLDALEIDRHFDRFRPGTRKLVNLAEHYGVTLADAHNAAGDARAAGAVVLAQAARYPELARMGARQATVEQAKWHRQWATSFSTYRVKKSQPPLEAADYLWPIARLPQDQDGPAGGPGNHQDSRRGSSGNGSGCKKARTSKAGSVATRLDDRAVSSLYGRIARCYDSGDFFDVWFQPNGLSKAVRLLIPGAPRDDLLPRLASWLCAEQASLTAVITGLTTGCLHHPCHDGVLVGICTIDGESTACRASLDVCGS